MAWFKNENVYLELVDHIYVLYRIEMDRFIDGDVREYILVNSKYN